MKPHEDHRKGAQRALSKWIGPWSRAQNLTALLDEDDDDPFKKHKKPWHKMTYVEKLQVSL